MSKLPEKVTYKARFNQNTKLIKEIFLLMKQNKKWWLLPIFIVFTILSLFLALVGGGSILPAIYAIF